MTAVEEIGIVLAELSTVAGDDFLIRGAWALFLQGSREPLPPIAEVQLGPTSYAAIRDRWEVTPGDLFAVIKTSLGGEIRFFVTERSSRTRLESARSHKSSSGS